MSETPYLDKIGLVSQASIDEVARVSHDYPDAVHTREELARTEPGRRGETRPYRRMERGRVQQVGGYMKHLQGQLAAWRSGPGKIAPDAWGLVGDEARKDLTMGPHNSQHRVAVQHHMRGAVSAIDKGDTPSAVGHLFTGAMEARDRGLEGPHQELLAHANGLRHDMGMGDIP